MPSNTDKRVKKREKSKKEKRKRRKAFYPLATGVHPSCWERKGQLTFTHVIWPIRWLVYTWDGCMWDRANPHIPPKRTMLWNLVAIWISKNTSEWSWVGLICLPSTQWIITTYLKPPFMCERWLASAGMHDVRMLHLQRWHSSVSQHLFILEQFTCRATMTAAGEASRARRYFITFITQWNHPPYFLKAVYFL